MSDISGIGSYRVKEAIFDKKIIFRNCNQGNTYVQTKSSVGDTQLNHDHFQKEDHRIKGKTDKDWIVLRKHVLCHFSDVKNIF